MLIPKQEHIQDEKYRRWLSTLPCIISGDSDVQVCHIRIGVLAGMGRKPSDTRCLPLSCAMHRMQHEDGELKFWYPYGGWEKAVALAKQLYEIKDEDLKDELALELIREWRE